MNVDNISAISSAAGVASQIPFTPKTAGNTSIITSINTKDLENANTAETIPLDNAVNIPLAKMLNPIKNSAIVQILFPVTARSYTGLPGLANTDTSCFVKRKDAAAISIEITPMTLRLTAISFLSFS